MREGEYIWVWAHEQAAYEAEGWQILGGRTSVCGVLHGAAYDELLMWREVCDG